MNTRIDFIAIGMAMAISTSAFAQDGYRPQNDAQRNYKACPADVMQKAVELVGPMCGTLPARPEFPDYETAFAQKLSKEELNAYSTQLTRFSSLVGQYQQCINQRVMADGSLSNETLNYAACADQFVVDQKGKSTEEWGMACLAQNDWSNPGNADVQNCFSDME